MMEQINAFLAKKPGRKTLVVVILPLLLIFLCCVCLILYFNRPPTPTPTKTATKTATPKMTRTLTPTPSPRPTYTLTFTVTASLTASITPSLTSTRVPTKTFTPSITPTHNPLNNPQYLAVFYQTGNVWVTSWDNSSLVELDGKDLHFISEMKIDSPNGIAIWQDKGLAYVTNRNNNTVTEIDLVAHKIRRTIAVGSQPFGVTVVQESGVVFVANRDSNDISCIPADGSPAITSEFWKGITLHGPVRLAGFPLNNNGQYIGAAMIVDMKGDVVPVTLASQAYTGIEAGSRCVVEIPLTWIGEDSLGDVAQSNSKDCTFYITDITGKFVELIPLLPPSNVATPQPNPQIKLPKSPLAVANLGKCVGVVVPDQNQLFLIDNDLKTIMGQKKIGKQGDNGGYGLAYNPYVDVVYVANAENDSVTRIEHPCQ